MIASFLGDIKLLELTNTVFLCSHTVPASKVLKSYDWAIEQRDKGNCVICGCHSKIEKDVVHYLLAGTQPLIIVLARGMMARIGGEFEAAIAAGRLLIITPFDCSIKRVTKNTAEKRNKYMIDLADEVVIGHARKGGMLEGILSGSLAKKVTML